MGNSLLRVSADKRLIEQLPLLMGNIGDQKGEENVKLLDLLGQNGILVYDTVDQFIDALILLTDLADIDALLRSRADGNELAADVVAGSQELMALQGCDDKHLRALPPHS